MTEYVTSADGTRIGYDRAGRGEPLVVVGGMLGDRRRAAALAAALADRFDVVNYDRRGRGDSTDTPPYAVERELDDLAALIDGLGGAAAVYGHSSGAGLALRAAAAGLSVTRLVLHEPPFGPDDPESRQAAAVLATTVRTALGDGRPGDAVAAFHTDSGLPPEQVEELRTDGHMLVLAPTMLYDLHVMGEFDGGTVPEHLVRRIPVPTLLLVGGASPDFFHDAARRIVDLLPDGRLAVLPGADHGAPAHVVAPAVTAFLTRTP